MENTNRFKNVDFSAILWAVVAVLLCALPCSAYNGILTVGSLDTVNLGTDYAPDYIGVDDGWADVYGILNMHPGAYVDWGIYANSGSEVNIYAGVVGEETGVPPVFIIYPIFVTSGAIVTVYGTDFTVDTGTIVDGSWTPGDGSGTLTGAYENNGPINLLFYSDVPIYLSAPSVTNQPPIAIAGQDGLIGPGGKIHPIYSSEQEITSVLGQGSDPEGEPIEYRWLEGSTVLLDWTAVASPPEAYLDLSTLALFSIGDHVLFLEVQEVGGDMLWSTDDMILRILNTPPSVQPTSTSIVVNPGDPISVGAYLADFDGDSLTYEWREGAIVIASGTATPPAGDGPVSIDALTGTGGTAPFELGVNELVIAVNDNVNPWQVSETVTVEVSDTDAPTLAPTASEIMLWPPNNTLHPVTIQANAEDNSGGPITLDVQVTSNEADEDDWVIDSVDNATGEIQLKLRADRSGSGDGRVYTVTITATDEANNSSAAIVKIRVSHNKRKN